MDDIWTLIAALAVLAGIYGLHHLALRREYARGLADGTHHGYAAGSGDAARRYSQGHEDGLIEGRAQAGRELYINHQRGYNEGYDQGYIDGQDALNTFSAPENVASPTMSA